MDRPLRSCALFIAAAGLVLAGCGSAEDSADDSTGGSGGDGGSSESSDATLTDKGGVVVTGADISDDAGDAESPVEVVVYEDFQCPYCKALEDASGDYLEDAMEDGDITVEYRVVSFLDKASANEYSSRAANAAMCVFDRGGPGAFHEFHETLFENQPEEGSAGPDNDQLTAYASDVGVDAASCIADTAMSDQVVDATKQMSTEGVTGTPTVFVDGEQVDLNSETAVQDAVDAAIG